MSTIKIGKLDTSISRLGLGTWAIGGGFAWGENDLEESIETIQACPSLGINLIDTAPAYNFGHSEEVLGKALKGMNREDIVLITKCGIVWTHEGSLFNKIGDRQLYKNLRRDSILEEVELSLKRLNTEYIDIYMVHWPSVEPYNTPISETMRTLMELKEQGIIRGIGAANLNVDQLKEYTKYGQLDIVQGKYSILDRKIENDLIPILKDNGIILQAYSPLEMGLLSGSIGREYIPQGARLNKKWFQPQKMQSALNMLDKWTPYTKKYNCSLSALAIAWILSQGDFITVLTGATTKSQLEENAKAAQVILSSEDIEEMRLLAEETDN